MEPHERRFCEFVDLLKSWLPWRSQSLSLSRDFWMPDQSCRVCYECDSQFTVFNRRHHCRLCGRVFCAKCTLNSVLVSSDDAKNVGEVGERNRVCNYCYKRWKQEVEAADNGVHLSSPILSPSLSTTSSVSTKSSGTCNSSMVTAGPLSISTGAYSHAPYSSGLNPCQTDQQEPNTDRQEMLRSNMDSVVDLSETFDQFGFCVNRSDDDDDDEYSNCHFDSEAPNFQTPNEYYGPVVFDEFDTGFRSKVYSANENTNAKRSSAAVGNDSELHNSSNDDKMGNGGTYECDASSTIFAAEVLDTEAVDFENSKQLWQPPEPEDEEDERESTLFDDDGEGATGEWGYLRSSNSFGSGEFGSRDRSSEGQRKAMKNIVDGHFRVLIAQLLQVENLPLGVEDNKESWLEIITTLSWEAATLLKPDTSKGGGMDPGGYIKVKCIASGHRCESMVVKGVACKKNVANRRMPSKILKPRFLILGGALEYQRVTNVLTSVDTLLQQEMDHLKMAVAKIDAHRPNVLLVEKSVSRYAQDFLLRKNISLVLNVKRPLLERIARCTGAQIVPSVDDLSSQKLGHCDLFRVEKYCEEHGTGGQGGNKINKTLMLFEGCPKPLGCTILLRGASRDELKKVKHVIQYGVFAAYHLALETSFLADEGASVTELPLKSPIAVALPDRPPSVDRSISTFQGFSNPPDGIPELTGNVSRSIGSDPLLSTGNFEDVLVAVSPPHSPERCNFEIPASVSAFPYSDVKEFSVVKEKDVEYTVRQKSTTSLTSPEYSSTCAGMEWNKMGFVGYHEAESILNNDETSEENSGLVDEEGMRCMVNDVRLDKKQITSVQLDSYDLGTSDTENNQREQNGLTREGISTSDHQSILVSHSSRCIWKGTVCERAHLFRIKYYGSFDKPLGRFLRDNLFDQSFRCRSCEFSPEAHVHCYTHRQGSLMISVRQQEFRLRGEQDGKIWMWHRCLRCPRINGFPPATRRIVMSDAAWGLSFGKFLDLSFSNNAAASRVATCGHSLHRDCLRFYGFSKMVACFRYAPVTVNSVYLPPFKLGFSCQSQDWIQKEADEVANKAGLLFAEILNKLHQIAESRLKNGVYNDKSEVLELRDKIADLEGILSKEKAEFEESLEKILKKEARKGHVIIDIFEVNKLRRQLLFQSYYWDQRLVCISSLEYNRAVSDVIARSREKLASVDKLADLNISPKPLKGYLSLDALPSKHLGRPLDHLSQSLLDQGKLCVEKDHHHIEENSQSSAIVNDLLDTMELVALRKVQSDVQMPAVKDLSDTLDAKWRGENEPTLAESSMPNARSVASVAPVLPNSEEWNRYGAENFSSRIEMPFLTFYRAMNKVHNAYKVVALNEYVPVYISSFQELEHQGGARLLLPCGANDAVIPVYDDEPTSIISYALSSSDYHSQMSDEVDGINNSLNSSLAQADSGNLYPFQSIDNMGLESFKSIGLIDDSLLAVSGGKNLILDPLAYNKTLHIRIAFSADGPLGKVKYTVTCYYAKRFDSLRRICCPSELDFIRSLSRCKKWGAQGGKSNAFFAKSLDDRFIIKQVTKTELESFSKFSPEYFKYLSESISTRSPTCLAKILGIYQITTKHVKGGKESKIDVLVMENLLFGRSLTRLYDLKGSSRSRYNFDSSGDNKVLLDQNLIETMPTSPIFVGKQAKRLLERAVWNDTAFLALIDVMDYSLLVGVDEEKHELVLGIIDFIRQYTWDKHLETWVKASGILGGPKNVSPTVISPKQYKKRFRKAMAAYFLVVPDQWSPSTIVLNKPHSELTEYVQHTSNQS